MSESIDRPFQTIVREGTATPLLRLVDRLGAWIAPTGSLRLRAQLGAAVVSLIPVPVLVLDTPTPGQLWIINLVAFDFFQLTFAWQLWQRIRTLDTELDGLLVAATPIERANILSEVVRWHRPTRVGLAMVSGGVFAAGIAVVYAVAREVYRPLTTADVVAIVVTGTIAGHSTYLTVFGIRLLRRLLGVTRVQVTWQAPINTPGLAGLSRVARRAAWLGLVLLALGQPPLVYMFLVARSPVVTVAYAVVFAIHVGLITASGIGAQVWISRRVETEKCRILSDLSTRIEEARHDLDDAPQRGIRHTARLVVLKTYVDLHAAIDATAHSYVGSATVTQYVASLFAVLLQFGIPVLIRTA